MILSIRTDNPVAEVGLYQENGQQIIYQTWQAHRELSETIFDQIDNILGQKNLKYSDLTGVIFYEGPGSFTGLRIGASLVNSLCFSLNIPTQSATGENWQAVALTGLKAHPQVEVLPIYGADPHITTPKK